MSAVQLGDEQLVAAALHYLDALGAPDRIADHLLDRGCFGGHNCDTCPIASYIRWETGLTVRVSEHAWHLTGRAWWLLPEHVEAFIAAHDRGTYPDLQEAP